VLSEGSVLRGACYIEMWLAVWHLVSIGVEYRTCEREPELWLGNCGNSPARGS
jgi:hypothetical protein